MIKSLSSLHSENVTKKLKMKMFSEISTMKTSLRRKSKTLVLISLKSLKSQTNSKVKLICLLMKLNFSKTPQCKMISKLQKAFLCTKISKRQPSTSKMNHYFFIERLIVSTIKGNSFWIILMTWNTKSNRNLMIISAIMKAREMIRSNHQV